MAPVAITAEPLPSKARDIRPAIAVVPFDSERRVADAALVGHAKVGINNRPAPVYCETPAHQQIEEAVRTALSSWGFPLVEPSAAALSLHGVVRRFWIDEYTTGYSPEYSFASVRWDLYLVEPGGRVVWTDTADVQVRTEAAYTDTTSKGQETLARATREAIYRVFGNAEFWEAVDSASRDPAPGDAHGTVILEREADTT